MSPMRTRRRNLFRFVLLAVLLVAIALGTTSCDRLPFQKSPSSTAYVVVQFHNGRTDVRTVQWSGEMTRIQALSAAGYDVEADANGEAICRIEKYGCPASDCFCPANLWAQGQWDGKAWDTSAWPPPPVSDGDVLAFRLASKADGSDWGLAGYLFDAPQYVAAARALEWLRTQQGTDGSYDDGMDPIASSVRTLIAIASAGYDAAQWGEPSLLTYLGQTAADQTVAYAQKSAATAGKLALALTWGGLDASTFARIDLSQQIASFYEESTGAYGAGSGDTAWAILGLAALGQPIPQKALEFLREVQHEDGGWAWNEMQPQSEVQHTAIVIQALLAGGTPPEDAALQKALAFIKQAANEDGGYPYQVPGESDPNTTAAVIQALICLTPNPTQDEVIKAAEGFLLATQQEDGSLQGWSSLYTTQESIPALLGRPYTP